MTTAAASRGRLRRGAVWAAPGLVLALLAAAGCAGLGRPRTLLPEAAAPGAVGAALVRHLDEQVLPTWTSPLVVDRERGGFLNLLDARGRPRGQKVKPAIAHLRLLYVHAVAITRSRGEAERARLRRQYEAGMAYLEQRHRDPRDGAWYYELDLDGAPADASKPMVVQVYAIYVLAEAARMLGDPRALALAEETFDRIEAGGWDPQYGGYLCNHTLPPDHPANAIRDVGTNFHALLALACLYRVSPRPVCREHIERLIELATTRFVHPVTGHAYTILAPDWGPVPGRLTRDEGTIYGHNAELVWYTLEAADAIGRDPRGLLPWAEPAAAAFARDGMTPDGATFTFGFLAGPATDKRVTFWGQAEAMALFLRLHRLTHNPLYYKHFETVARWTFTRLVNPRTGWWTPCVDTAGREVTDLPAGMHWIAGLHVTRMLLEAEQDLVTRGAGL